MSFVPDMDQWVNTHFVDVPALIEIEVGPLAGKSVLDVGCGEMLISLGMLGRGAASVTALDIKPVAPLIEGATQRIEKAGFSIRDRLNHLNPMQYAGVKMPFPDNTFDIIVSWGVFEHITDVLGVLREIRRTLKPDGVSFIKVYPWFHSFYGSHLSDYTPESFSHLIYDRSQMRTIVEANVDSNPQLGADFVLGHLWEEYETLNGYSANMFYRAVKEAGFSRDVWKLISHVHDLSKAPPGVELSELMISGTETLLHK